MQDRHVYKFKYDRVYFLAFPETNLENCFKKKKKLISAYLDHTLNYKEILRLNRIFNESEEIENISEEEIVNFYNYHLNKNKYFLKILILIRI